MDSTIGQAVQGTVARLLKPLVRLLLHYGVPFGSFMEIAKRIYIDVAFNEFTIPGKKPTISRTAVITGLSRKEILRVQRLPSLEDEQVQARYNRAVRVISGWARDEAFSGQGGEPAALPLEGGTVSFTALVKRYSGDVPPRAVLDELLRVGAVERLDDGRVRLASRAYIPATGEEEKLGILGSDVADLISTIGYNLQAPPEETRFQLKVAYDNVPREPLGAFRTASSQQAFRLLEDLDQALSRIDRDVNPSVEGSGRMRAGISIYYFEEELPG